MGLFLETTMLKHWTPDLKLKQSIGKPDRQHLLNLEFPGNVPVVKQNQVNTHINIFCHFKSQIVFPEPYADDPDTRKIEKTKVEPGITSVTNLKKQFNEDVIFTSKLDIFTDLEAFNRIDMTWENNLTLKVAKHINVSVDLVLFYDRDITRKLQIKQVLAVGFTYTLF